MAVVHEEMHQRTGEDQEPRQPCAVCSVSKKNPATIRKPRATSPIGVRHQGCSCRSSFMAGSLSQRATRRLIKLYSAPNTSAMYQPQMKLSAIPRQKLRQLSNSKPGKKIDSAACLLQQPKLLLPCSAGLVR